MSGLKRAAEKQLSRDDDDDRDSQPEEFATTPQIADAEELATRRMVTVKRSTAPPASSAGGFFKGVAGAPAPGAPGFSFGAKTAEEAPKVPSSTFGFGAAPAAAPAAAAAKDENGADGKPAPSKFSFGAPPSAEAPKFNFSFGSSTTSTSGATAPVGFGFNFGAKAPAQPASETASKEGGGSSGETKPAEPPKVIFGSTGGFSFKDAANSFAEAQRKLTEEKKASADATTEGEATATGGNADDADDDAPKLFANASSIVSSSGEVLACGPSKLYIYEKNAKEWKERGQGDAKVKKDVVPVEEGENAKQEKTVFRLMVRDGYSLNAIVSKKAFVLSKEAEKHIIFSIATADAGVETYLLKFTGPTAESTTKKVIEELKKVIEATD